VTAHAADFDAGSSTGAATTFAAPSPVMQDSSQRIASTPEREPDHARVRLLGALADEDLAVALDRATVFVQPSLAEGFGVPLLEAFFFGTPVVHSDAPALIEVAGGAGLVVPLSDMGGYPERLAAAISSVVRDADLARRLSYAGLDRAGAFSWRDAAQRVWQLHADL
jgi:glycosyltransferase involved in cell wall biosynthesis